MFVYLWSRLHCNSLQRVGRQLALTMVVAAYQGIGGYFSAYLYLSEVKEGCPYISQILYLLCKKLHQLIFVCHAADKDGRAGPS